MGRGGEEQGRDCRIPLSGEIDKLSDSTAGLRWACPSSSIFGSQEDRIDEAGGFSPDEENRGSMIRAAGQVKGSERQNRQGSVSCSARVRHRPCPKALTP